jgi:hypothetical protein
MSIALVLVTSCWNSIGIFKLTEIAKKYEQKPNHEIIWEPFIVKLLVLNEIVIPILALAILSPICFKYALNEENPIQYTVNSSKCGALDIFTTQTCIFYDNFELAFSFQPPFQYSYQCSSIFITNYTHTLVFRAIFDGLLTPGLIAIGRYVTHKSPSSDHESIKPNHLMYYIYELSESMAAVILKPSSDETLIPIFYTKSAIIKLSVNLIVLVLFGSIFPLIAVMMCISSICYVCYLEIEIGRLLDISDERGLQSVDNHCKDVAECFRNCILPVIVKIPLFYSIFLFDIFGDELGLQTASIIFITIFIATILFLLATHFSKIINRPKVLNKSGDIELISTKVNPLVVTNLEG